MYALILSTHLFKVEGTTNTRPSVLTHQQRCLYKRSGSATPRLIQADSNDTSKLRAWGTINWENLWALKLHDCTSEAASLPSVWDRLIPAMPLSYVKAARWLGVNYWQWIYLTIQWSKFLGTRLCQSAVRCGGPGRSLRRSQATLCFATETLWAIRTQRCKAYFPRTCKVYFIMLTDTHPDNPLVILRNH